MPELIKILIIYLIVTNVVTFFMYGVDKWKAKRSKWRIREAALLLLAALGGSIGAWLGMHVWHHKTMHKKFRYGIPLIFILQVAIVAAFALSSCSHHKGNEQESPEAIAERIWNLSQFRPDGFTIDIRTMEAPTEGIAVAYAATQGCHSREGLVAVVKHALEHDGYVGGWYDSESGLYYFDSTRLFPEDQRYEALQFARDNSQLAVYVLSTGEEIRLDQQIPIAA
jgi:uncharacterized membrane protein YsdA (DUF1294 family)